MNVLHLCTKVLYPSNDGGALGIVAFINLLLLKGIKPTVLAANTPKHFQASIPENTEGTTHLSVTVDTGIKPLKVLKNLLFSNVPYMAERFLNKAFEDKLKELITRHNVDIVQLEGPHMGIYLPFIRKHSKAKVVLRAHNVEHLLWRDIKNETPFSLKKLYLSIMVERFRKFESRLISQVDGIVPVTTVDLELIKIFASPPKNVVVPFPIDISKYVPQECEVGNSIFYIGALDWIPNQNGLCWFIDQVWPSLKNNFSGLTFQVAGRNAPNWLKTKMQDNRIIFHGEVSNASQFMNKYQIQVVPLFSGSGIRVKILEGMALCKAIVTTTKGAEGINVVSGEELIIADDAKTFQQKISDLLDNKTDPATIGIKARAFISKEFDNLALANRVVDFYQSLA